MKIGIVTFIDYGNYGNRLQNYAVQELIKSYGAEAETILTEKYYEYQGKTVPIQRKIIHIINVIWGGFYSIFNFDCRQTKYIKKKDRLEEQRCFNNKKFTDKYITETNFMMREGYLYRNKLKKYDYVFTGSDQVWNPNMAAGNAMFYLQNVEKGKRVAISASFGIDQIPNEFVEQTRKYISEMDYISVREKTGKDIVCALSDKECEVLLDPTMLIPEEIWEDIIRDTDIKEKEGYILTYFLGEVAREDMEALSKYAYEKELEIMHLNNREYPNYYTLDAAEFIKYIKYADLIITDSYHACVFSLIFNKNFYVLKRRGAQNKIYTRIENLLETFECKECALDDINQIKLRENNNLEKRGRNIRDILQKERKKAGSFFEQFLC